MAVIFISWLTERIIRLIGTFHLTSYQAIFASHHTRDRHVGFQFTCEGIGKSNKICHYFLFSSYHKTKLQPSDKNINTHTRMKFQILPWSKSKVPASFVVYLHTALCKRKPSDFENRARLIACRVVQTLYCFTVAIVLTVERLFCFKRLYHTYYFFFHLSSFIKQVNLYTFANQTLFKGRKIVISIKIFSIDCLQTNQSLKTWT